jgi:hypothetical protein
MDHRWEIMEVEDFTVHNTNIERIECCEIRISKIKKNNNDDDYIN